MNIEERIKEGEALIEKAQAHEPILIWKRHYTSSAFKEVTGIYNTALHTFQEVLDVNPNNEAAVDGFAYSLAKLCDYYSSTGLGGMTLILELNFGHYLAKHIDFLEKSPRMHSDLRQPYKK